MNFISLDEALGVDIFRSAKVTSLVKLIEEPVDFGKEFYNVE